jgi:hypothetical protein
MGWVLGKGVIVAERAAPRKAPARARRDAEAAAPADSNSMRVASHGARQRFGQTDS